MSIGSRNEPQLNLDATSRRSTHSRGDKGEGDRLQNGYEMTEQKDKDIDRLCCLVDRNQMTFASQSAYQQTNHREAERLRQGIPWTTYLCPTQRVRQRRVYQPERDK